MSLYSSVTFFPHSGNTFLIFNLLADMWALRSQGIIFFAPANDIRISYSESIRATSATGNFMIWGGGSCSQGSSSCTLKIILKTNDQSISMSFQPNKCRKFRTTYQNVIWKSNRYSQIYDKGLDRKHTYGASMPGSTWVCRHFHQEYGI